MQQYRKNLGKVSLTAEGVWDGTKAFDILSIVYDEHTQHGFISRKAVPEGVDLYNKEYWMPLNVSGYADNNIIILSKKTAEHAIQSYTLEEAIASIRSVGRRPGAILGFYNENADRLDIGGRWELWQFNDTNVYNWDNVDSWQNLYYNYNKFMGWFKDENFLNKYAPFPEIGCYAFVGSEFNEATVYRCDNKYVWNNTTQHAWDYVKVVVDGNVTVGENGNWFNNGEDTGIPASIKGENGKTPIFRENDNTIQYSFDNVNWITVSDKVAAWFRWNATTGDTQANNVGRIQISRDNVIWTNLSGDIINNLHISRYIGADESLPTSGIAEGTIYAKGPTYSDGDTSHANPIYRLWVYAWKDNALAWQDNGEFTSIAAGVVQETGDSETEVMSQKAVSVNAYKKNELTDFWYGGMENGSVGNDNNVYGVKTVRVPVRLGDTFTIWHRDISEINSNLSNSELTYSYGFYDEPYGGGRSAAGTYDYIPVVNIKDSDISNNRLYLSFVIYGTAEKPLRRTDFKSGDVIVIRKNSGTIEFINELINQSETNLKSIINEVNNRFNYSIKQCFYWGSGIGYIDVDTSNLTITVPAKFTCVIDSSKYITTTEEQTVQLYAADSAGSPIITSLSILQINNETGRIRNLSYTSYFPNAGNVLGWSNIAIIKRTYADSTTKGGDVQLCTTAPYRVDGNVFGLKSVSDSVLTQNKDIENYIEAAIFNKYDMDSASMKTNRFTFIHSSDTHADEERHNNIISYMNAFPGIQGMINTGDIQASNFTTSADWFINSLNKTSKFITLTIGNHEVGNSFNKSICGTNEEVYNKFIAPIKGKSGMITTDKCYWYKDVDDFKIRIISVYEYDDPNDTDPSDESLYRIYRGIRTISEAQMYWFLDTLNSTPKDYAVIVLTHQNPTTDGALLIRDSNWDCTSVNLTPQNCLSGNFFNDAINAWKTGSRLPGLSYTHAGNASYLGQTIITYDFSNRGVGEFIGFFFGHSHGDSAGTFQSHPDQHYVAVTCTSAFIDQSSFDDLPRNMGYKSENAFNVVSVDRESKTVYIIRVGSNRTKDLKERLIYKYNY